MRTFACLSACLALLAARTVSAQQVAPQEGAFQPLPPFRSQQGYIALQGGISHSDNLLLSPEDKRDDVVPFAGFAVDYTHKSNKLFVDAQGVLDWVEYLEHSYHSTAQGTLNGVARWGSADDLFQWTAKDSFGQASDDPLSAPSVANMENINYFSTGPRVNLPLGGHNQLSLYGLYSDTEYQRSPFDSYDVTGGATLSHALSSSSNIALDVSTRRTSFRDQPPDTTYDLRSAYLSYDAEIARTTISAEAGYNQLRRAGVTSGGDLLSLQIARRISYTSTVYLRGEDDYLSAGDALSTQLITPIPVAVPGLATAQPYKDRKLAAGWNFSGVRSTLSLQASAERESFVEQSTYDRKDLTIEAMFERRLRPTLLARLVVTHSNDKFENVDARLTDSAVEASLWRTFGRLSMSLSYRWRRRTVGGAPNDVATPYVENLESVGFSYDLLGQGSVPR